MSEGNIIDPPILVQDGLRFLCGLEFRIILSGIFFYTAWNFMFKKKKKQVFEIGYILCSGGLTFKIVYFGCHYCAIVSYHIY